MHIHAPLIRLRRRALYKFVLIDWLIEWTNLLTYFSHPGCPNAVAVTGRWRRHYAAISRRQHRIVTVVDSRDIVVADVSCCCCNNRRIDSHFAHLRNWRTTWRHTLTRIDFTIHVTDYYDVLLFIEMRKLQIYFTVTMAARLRYSDSVYVRSHRMCCTATRHSIFLHFFSGSRFADIRPRPPMRF